MISVILASSNKHKAEELSVLFDPNVVQVAAASEKIEVVEDGKTYHDNALLKAKAYYDRFKCPVVADDSGLNVDALPGELAVQTARFGGDNLTAQERYELLLRRLKDVPAEKRQAHFICVLCFYLNPNEVFFFEGRVDGNIAFEAQGEHGFGYDPVFIPTGLDGQATLAQLPEWKDKNSHRARAVQAAQKFFAGFGCQKG